VRRHEHEAKIQQNFMLGSPKCAPRKSFVIYGTVYNIIMASYTTIIKGGTVISNRRSEKADVGIKGDKISFIGNLSDASADKIIDATGKHISSGFIDITCHSDTHWTLFSDPSQESLLTQGITTILGGNCGASLAPLVKSSDISVVQRWTDINQINVNWHSLSEFFEELSKRKIGVNFATLVGHGILRRGVLGDEARHADVAEIASMEHLLKEAMEDGAFGLSTNLGSAHGRSAGDQELRSLFRVIKENGGFTKHHLKDEGKNILPSIVELIRMARESGTGLHLSHFKILGRGAWPFFHDAVELLDSAENEGLRISADLFPYTKTGSALYQLLPPWILEGGSKDKILESSKDKNSRLEIKAFLKSLTLHYEKMIIASALKDSASVGKTVAELSNSSGLDPEEFIIRILEANQLACSIFNEVINIEHVSDFAKKNWVAIASDGVGYSFKKKNLFDLPHPRSFGAFPKAFEVFLKERDALRLEDLVYKMTELPASIVGLKQRGRLEKDNFADIVVFDFQNIGGPSEYGNPYLPSTGIEHVFVNGKAAVEGGKLSGTAAGRILRRA